MSGEEVPVAIAALAIAIAALFAATLQIAQAILASAKGLPNCNESVIGVWAKHTKRTPKVTQLRLEVKYEAPVIFLAPASQEKGPVKDESGESAKVWHAEGTPKSCDQTRVSWRDVSIVEKGENRREQVHTVENERATWLWLLVAIERMEKESKDWERHQHGPKPPNFDSKDLTLTVKMQAKQRSFDNLAIKKPYATTTISHLVELAAVLGLYWKVFDRDDNRYRAEGNGYSLTGSRITDFGLVFVFEKTGATVFEERRIIPTSEIKELCFGRVPTLYRSKGLDKEGVEKPEDMEWQNPQTTSSGDKNLKLEILQLGSRDEIAETLTQIGCNVNTTLYFKREHDHHHHHLFPVAFEVIGMMARTLHIHDRCFRFLPNPTIFRWSRDSMSILRLLEAFSDLIDRDCKVIDQEAANKKPAEEGVDAAVKSIKLIKTRANQLNESLQPGHGGTLTCAQMNHLHEAIDLADGILTAGESPSANQKVVLDVLRRHLQEVLAAINNADNKKSDKDSKGDKNGTGRQGVSFGNLLGVPLEVREQRFMETYFDDILWRIISTDSTSKGDQEQVSRAIHEDNTKTRRLSRVGNGQGHSVDIVVTSSPITTPTTTPTDPMGKWSKGDNVPTPGLTHRGTWPRSETPKPSDGKTQEEPKLKAIVKRQYEMQRLAIWYTLVFRMICWLMLHDFDKRDRQMPSIELMGNRQPVFIT